MSSTIDEADLNDLDTSIVLNILSDLDTSIVLNTNSLYKKMNDKKNIRSTCAEIKAIRIFSKIGKKIDCAGIKLPNGKKTDFVIIRGSKNIYTEVYSPWKEQHDFIEKIKKEGVAGITAIDMIRKIVKEKYCNSNGKCQFSENVPHLFIIDLDDSMTDIFPIINHVSEFVRAFSCKVFPKGNSGLFHEKDMNEDYKYKNISLAVGMRSNWIIEIIPNPNAINRIPTTFLNELKKLIESQKNAL